MNTNTNTHNFSPVEIVANLDMIGTLLCTIRNGVPCPPDVMLAALIVLRETRDDIAKKHSIGEESQYQSVEYTAAMMVRQMEVDEG
jgi:hypothetical protein